MHAWLNLRVCNLKLKDFKKPQISLVCEQLVALDSFFMFSCGAVAALTEQGIIGYATRDRVSNEIVRPNWNAVQLFYKSSCMTVSNITREYDAFGAAANNSFQMRRIRGLI